MYDYKQVQAVTRRLSPVRNFMNMQVCWHGGLPRFGLKQFVYLTGDLERLRRYWMTGSCKPGKEQHKSSDPLALEQFLSAFLLLMLGILLSAGLLLGEHIYFKCVRKHLVKTDKAQCCALISLVRDVTVVTNNINTNLGAFSSESDVNYKFTTLTLDRGKCWRVTTFHDVVTLVQVYTKYEFNYIKSLKPATKCTNQYYSTVIYLSKDKLA